MTFDEFLKEACPPQGLDWRKYRRRAARHRVEARLQELGLDGFAAYLEWLRSYPLEAAGLADRMRVTVSRFFRERERWDILVKNVIPLLLRNLGPDEPLSAWSVGCGGGEEPYTLALLWREHFPQRPVDILATDIDTSSIDRAREAAYLESSLREVPPSLLHRFSNTNNRRHLDESITGMVRFERHNLMTDPLPGRFDLILCRYLVFTYYRGDRRLSAAHRLREAMKPGGALMIGLKEELGAVASLFSPWQDAPGVFLKQKNAGSPA